MMDWEGESRQRASRSSERLRAQAAPAPQRSRNTESYRVDFPNYLNPYRQVAQPKRARPAAVSQQSATRSKDKRAYYQQLHQEVEDYRKYRNHRPFKRTEVPSIWQHTASPEKSQAFRDKQPVESSPPNSGHSSQPKTKTTAVSGKTRTSRAQNGRNIDFSGILSREPEISEQTFKQRYVTEDRDLPPYLKKEMNGENKRHEQ